MPEKNSFTDTEGRVWTFRVTARVAMELKQSGFDVRSVNDPETIDNLLDADMEVLNHMSQVLLPQLEERNITANELFDALDGQTCEKAIWAFVYGCVFFFPSHKQNPILEWLQRLMNAQSQSASLLTEKIQNADLETLVKKNVNELTRGW